MCPESDEIRKSNEIVIDEEDDVNVYEKGTLETLTKTNNPDDLLD